MHDDDDEIMMMMVYSRDRLVGLGSLTGRRQLKIRGGQ